MPRRPAVVLLFAALLVCAGSPLSAAESAGVRDLAAGREAMARREYPAAVKSLQSAARTLDPARDSTALGDAWLHLGIAYLNGPEGPTEALAAFLASAEVSPEPSTAWLWASVAAEMLGKTQEAVSYRLRALAPRPSAPEWPDPAPAPAPEAPAPAAPTPEAPAAEPAPQEKPDAVQHFFGETEPQEKPKDEKDGKGDKDKEKKEREEVDAIDHFFGEKEQPAPEAKPPV